MMKIQHITDKNSRGILFYITHLVQKLEGIDNGRIVELRNWMEINFFKKYDVSHFHVANSTRFVLVTLPIFRSKVKVITIHDVIPRTKKIPIWFTRVIYRYLDLFLDEFIVHSEFAKGLLLQVAPFISIERISVIPIGCTIFERYDIKKLRREYGFSDDDIILLMAGFVKKAKGQLEVIKIFRDLNLRNAKLLVVGKAVDKESQIELRNLSDKSIIYVGFVDDRKFIHYIELSDILINYRLNSVGESSYPTAMAIGAGKPVICSNIGSFPEIVKNAGLIVESTQDIKEAIIKFCSDEKIRKKITKLAECERDKYSWANIAMKHLNLYKRLLEGEK